MVKHQLGNITEYSGDAIFNSLGNKDRLDEKGSIYRSILAVANPSLHDEVLLKGSTSVEGDCFLTDSHGLPCKRIIHLITPFKYQDEDCSVLRESVLNAIEYSYSNGIRTICIPLLGTGYNGYSDAESFDSIMSAAKMASWRHKDLDISLFTLKKEERDQWLYSRTVKYSTSLNENTSIFDSRPEKYDDGRVHFMDFRREIPSGSSIGKIIDMYIEKNRDSFPKEFMTGKKKVYKKESGHEYDPLSSNCWKEIQKQLEWISKQDVNTEDTKIYDRSARTRIMWSEHKNEKTKFKKAGSVMCWRRPTKVSVIVAGIALRMNPSDVYFMCRFCGYYLSGFDAADRLLKSIIESDDEERRMLEVWSTYPQVKGCNGWSELSNEKESTVYPPLLPQEH